MSNKNVEAIYALSPMQQGMLFHSLYSPESASGYFEWIDFPLKGRVDTPALKRAWQTVVDRHSILRTAFVWERKGEPLQVVRQKVALPWEELDWRDLSPAQQQRQLDDYRLTEQQRGFELTRAPLMRVGLIRLAEDVYRFVWCNHHLILDGWSRVLLINEVFALYRAYSRGEELHLEKSRPYGDYIAWLQRQDTGDAERFWRQTLAGFTAHTPLVADYSREAASEKEELFEKVRISLSPGMTTQLQTLARQHQLTLNSVVHGMWGLLLSRYSGQDDVLFGTVVSGRPAELAGVEQMIGLFINTLPARVRVQREWQLLGWLQQVQEHLAAAREYEYSPLVDVQGWSEVPRGQPLFESIVVFENYPIDASMRASANDDEIESDRFVEKSNYPLTLLVIPGQELSLQLSYDCRRFRKSTIVRMLAHLQTLFEGIAANPRTKLTDLTILTAAEQRQLLVEWNDTTRPFPADRCIHQLFEEQVRLTPEAVAVNDEKEQLSYAELNARSNRLAHYLREQGVGAEVLVGICMERSVEMVVSLLAILKAGGAYVPLDPTYPEQRLNYMLQDAGVRLLLSERKLWARMAVTEAVQVHCRENWNAELAQYSTLNPAVEMSATNLAYVSYTSGSTGVPKGVGVTHRNVARLVKETNYVEIRREDVFLQFAPVSFDASTFELWGCLTNGARLAVYGPELPSLEELGRYIEKQRVSVLWLTAGLFHRIVDEELESLLGVRHLVSGGDVLSAGHVRKYLSGGGQELINGYGPTENTTFTTFQSVREAGEVGESVSIGEPIGNTTVYVLDEAMQLVPVGVRGELYIGGEGLARGYLQRPELTAERFVPHPYSLVGGERLYRTGDEVRWSATGRLEFIGRLDQQVKLRGYRIELGEVEAALSAQAGVQEAVVVVREDEPGEKRLVGYVVAEAGAEVSSSELRRGLQERLPDYMVPAALVMLEQLPLTANGKVNRRALPAPDGSRPELEATYVGPRTAVEEVLVAIWSEVLRVEQVGIHDNFFELGGDSILSIQIIARANQSGVRLSPRQLFQQQTIAALAQVAVVGPALSAEQGTLVGQVPLTPIQRWFFAQPLTERHHFNQAVLLQLRQRWQPELLPGVLGQLLAHHDGLRLRYEQDASGEWRQFYGRPVTAEVVAQEVCSFHDLSGLGASEQEAALAAVGEQLQRSMSLQEGPLVRVALFELGEAGGAWPQRLLVIMHHLVVDGVSWRIVLEDLQTAYAQASSGREIKLAAKTSSYKQWAERLERYGASGEGAKELEYWRAQVAAGRQQRLPEDYAGGENTVATMGVESVWLTAAETRSLLREVPAAYHTQINDVLLTALVQVMRRWTGSEGLLVELESHGREDCFAEVDVTRTVGWFTSAYPVWLELSGAERSAEEELRAVQEQLRAVPGRGVGYGVLRYLSGAAGLELPVAAERAQVCFNYLGQFDHVFEEGAVWGVAREQSGAVRSEQGERKRLLEINGSVVNGQLQLSWSYSQRVHRRETIKQLGSWYKQALLQLIAESATATQTYLPSDFPLARLNKNKVSKVAALLEEADESQLVAMEAEY